MTIENDSQVASEPRSRARSRAGDTRHMSHNVDSEIWESLAGHRQWRHFGRKQGAECECYSIFYPETNHIAAIKEAHRKHLAEALASAGFGSVVIMRQWIEENLGESE